MQKHRNEVLCGGDPRSGHKSHAAHETKPKGEVETEAGFAELLKKRAQLIAEHAMFRDDDDAVPVSGTVATVVDIDANGVIKQRDANLLGDNYFGVSKFLSR